MIPDETLPPAAGHNQPPSPVEALVAAQGEALVPFTPRRDELVEAATKKQVFDRISAGDAGDIIRIAAEVFRRIDQDRRDRTDPYRRAADAAKGLADEFWLPVDDALAALRARLHAWSDAEDMRIADQQAEQETVMRAMREQTGIEDAAKGEPGHRSVPAGFALPATRRKIRGDLGSTVTSGESDQFRVIDIKMVPDWIMETPTVHEAIVKVVKAMARHTGDIPGIERTTISNLKIL